MSSADRLRRAARVLRERAELAEPTPWTVSSEEGSEWWDIVTSPGRRPRDGCVETVADCDTDEETATYIATMNPLVGLALAEVLEQKADFCFTYPGVPSGMEGVADLILGGDDS